MSDDQTPAATPDNLATGSQRRMMHALWKQHGITDREDRLRITGVMLNKLVESSCTLSRADASRLIDSLLTDGPQDLF
jgi:hypothetical protein